MQNEDVIVGYCAFSLRLRSVLKDENIMKESLRSFCNADDEIISSISDHDSILPRK